MQHPPFWTLLGVGDLDLAGDSEGKTIAGPIGRFCGNHSPEHHDHPPPQHTFISVFFFKFDFKYLQHHTSSPPDITNELLLSAKPTR